MSVESIGQLYAEFTAISEHLTGAREVTYANTADDTFKKFLLLSCASYHEDAITQTIIDFTRSSSENLKLVEFINRKALKQSYHSLFSWTDQTAAYFFAYFGDIAKAEAKAQIAREKLEKNVVAFLYIGNMRNNLVHKDLSSFSFDITSAEVYEKFLSANMFVDFIGRFLQS